MNLQIYSQESAKFVESRGRAFDLEHAAMGIITEIGELIDAHKRLIVYGKPLDTVNLREEVGDCLWYAALAARSLELDLDELRNGGLLTEDEIPNKSALYAAMFAGAAGATFGAVVVGLNNDGEDSINNLAAEAADFLGVYVELLGKFSAFHGFTLEEAAAANIAKLSVRFPNGFTPESALNRDLAAEGSALRDAGGQPA